MNKFGRNYILTVETANGSLLTFTPPLTLEFDITRNILSSANVCSIRMLNLSVNHRNQIRFNIMDTNTFRAVRLQAGYGNVNLPIIFTGNITQAWSVREGVNFVTSIECFDGGYAFANGMTSTTFPAGTAQDEVLSNLATSLPQVTLGAVGSFPGQLSRGNSYIGNTADLLRTESGGAFFVDNGQAHIIGNSEYIDDGPPVIVNAASGLLNTPVREQTVLNFDILFSPEIKPGRLVQLQSLTDPSFNGLKKVTGVKHRGTISGAVCGDAVTSVSTWFEQSYTPVEIIQ